MIRRFNYTGRKTIPQKTFNLVVKAGLPRQFDASFDLTEYQFPDDAALYFEAYSSGATLVVRFPWGTAGRYQSPANRSLEGVPGDNVLFNFKVVDETGDHGRILGICRQIVLRGGAEGEGAGRTSLLPVNATPLGQQVWRVSFENDQPWLEVNSSIPDIKERAQHDPEFLALVYPAVVRQILTEVLVDRDFSDLLETEKWESRWLRWGIRFHPDKTEPPELDNRDRSERKLWVEHVVGGFCNHYNISDSFLAGIQGGETE